MANINYKSEATVKRSKKYSGIKDAQDFKNRWLKNNGVNLSNRTEDYTSNMKSVAEQYADFIRDQNAGVPSNLRQGITINKTGVGTAPAVSVPNAKAQVTTVPKNQGRVSAKTVTEPTKAFIGPTNTGTVNTVSADLVNRVAQNADNGVADITRSYAQRAAAEEQGTSFMTDNLAAREASRRREESERRQAFVKAGIDAANSYDRQNDAKYQADKARQAQGIDQNVLSSKALEQIRSMPQGDGTTLGNPVDATPIAQDSARNTKEYQWARKHPWAATAVSVGMNPVTGVEGLVNTGRQLFSEDKLDANQMRGAMVQNSLRQGIMRGTNDNLADDKGLIRGLDTADDGRVSGAENVSNFVVGTGIDALNSTVGGLAFGSANLALMSGNVANQELLEGAQDDNKTRNQMLMTAVAKGAAEAVFEKVSLENLITNNIHPSSFADILKNYFRSFVTEGSEEFFTDIADYIADGVINGSNSEVGREYNELILSGMSADDALAQVVFDCLKNAGVSFLGGGISGGVSTLGGGLYGTAMNSMNLGTVEQAYQNKKDMYQDIANNAGEYAQVKNMAQAYADKVNEGKEVSFMERGYLANAMDDAVERETEKMKHESEYDSFRDFKKSFKTIYGSEGQAVFDSVVRADKNFSDDVDTFNRIYNAGRYGKELKDAGDFSRFGERSSEIFKAGVKDSEAGFDTFAKNVEQLEKNPQNVKHGTFISSTPRTSEAMKTAMERFTKAVPFSVAIVDTNDVESLTSALSQLKDRGLVDNQATVESVFRTESTGASDTKRGFAVIDINTDNFLNTLGHELTHIAKVYDLEGYKAYAKAVLYKLANTEGYNLEGKIAYIQQEYRERFGQELSRELAEEELVAESADYLNDEDVVRDLVSKDRTFAEKIRDWLQSVAKLLKDLMDTTTSREEAKALRKDQEFYQHAAEMWTSMLNNAADSYAGYATTESTSKVEGMIRNQLDLSEGMGTKVKVPGNPLTTKEIFSLDEEIMARNDKYNEATRNAWKNIIEADDFVSLGFPHGEYMYYILSPSARKENKWQITHFDKDGPMSDERFKEGDEKRLYDVLESYTPRNGVDVTVVKVKDMIGSLPEQTRFQVKKPIEKTKDLIAVHNLSAEQLLNSLDMGGFPSPSIAVIKDSMSHTKYGDTTVMFYRETVDPKIIKKNKLYGGDAWTPTYPTIDYKVSMKELKNVAKRISELAGMNLDAFGYAGFDEDNVENALSGKGTLANSRYSDMPIVKLAYLKDSGVDVEPVYKEKALYNKLENSEIAALSKVLSDSDLEKYTSDWNYGYEHKEETEKVRKLVNEVVAESKKDLIESLRNEYEKTGKKFLKKNMEDFQNWFNEDNFRGDDLYALAKAVREYRENGTEKKVLDTYATRDRLNELMKGREDDYGEWINKLFGNIVEKKGIRNNKDQFLPSGNRRSWEALHDSVTLDNLTKAMNRRDAKGDAFFSVMGIKAIATKDFSSIDEAHKNEHLLREIDEEEYKKLQDEYATRFTDIVNEILPKNENEFVAFDRTADIIADTIRTKKTVRAIDAELRKWLPTVKPDTAQKLVELMEDVSNMPTGYFEAKPQRSVYNNEIAEVITPDSGAIHDKLIEVMKNKGIAFKEYKAGNEEERAAKVNDTLTEKPELRFQLGTYSVNSINYKVAKDGENAISEDGLVVPVITSNIISKRTMNTGNPKKIASEIEAILREMNGEIITIISSGEQVEIDYDFASEYTHSNYTVGLRKSNTKRAKYNAVSKITDIIENASNKRYEADKKGNKHSNADRGLNRYDVTFWTSSDSGYDSYEGELVVRLDKNGHDYVYDIVKLKKTAVARIENNNSRDIGPQSVDNKISEAGRKNNSAKAINKNFRYQLDTSGRKLSSGQSEYFADSKVRDNDGNLMVMYHGTPSGNFNTFRDGLNFFTPNKEYATQYESPSQSSRTAGKTADTPKTYEVYLNIKHPFDIRNAEDRQRFINDYVKGGWALGINPYVDYKDTTKTGLPSWEEADNIYEWMEENDLLDEYDGILVDEGGTESGFDRGISYVTFNPNQIKSVNNENPSDDNDIRYQLGVPSEMFYNEDAGDKRYAQANTYLTNMLQASKDLTPSDKDIKKVVKGITEAYNSKMNKAELTRQLTELYTYMRTNDRVDGAQVSQTINAIARQVIREATFTDSYQQDLWDRFRNELRDTTIYVDPDYVRDIDPDGMNALRKRYFGRVKLTSNPSKIGNDGIRTYMQLQELFPDIYTTNVDDITSDADAINEILYGFEKARPKEMSVFGDASTEEEATQALAERIMDAYFEVGNQSVKTQYQKTYKQLREEMKDEIIREYNDNLRAKQINDSKELANLRDAYTAGDISADAFIVRKAALEDYKKQQDAAARELFRVKRDKYVDRVQRNKYKDDIIKTSKQLANMILSPTDKKHIPTEMVEPISKVLQYIDFSSNRVHPDGTPTRRTVEADEFHRSIQNILGVLAKIEKNNSVYENNGETAYLVIDPDLMENLREVSESFANNDEIKDNIDNLSTQNLRTVQQTLRALNQMVNNANRFISMERYNTVSELATQSISDFENALNSRGKLRQGVDKARRRYELTQMFDDLLTSGMLDAYTYFHGLGDTGHTLYDNVRAGLDRQIRNTRTAVEYMEDSMERNKVSVKERNKWENDLIEVELDAVPIGGSTPVKMKAKVSAAQLMSLYLLNKRDQAKMHLYGNTISKNIQNGGFVLEASGKNKNDIDTKHVFKVTEAQVDELISKLTPKQKAVADDIARFLTDVTSKWGNEVTQKLYGYNKFEAKNYFPIKVDNSTIATTSASLERGGMSMLKNMGQTKSVQQRAYNPLTLQNIFDVYTAQAEDMGNYNAYVTPTADLQMWLNYKGKEGNVKRALTNAYGEKANEYFMNLLRDINQPRTNGDKWDKMAGKALGLARAGAIWGNLRVAVQQPFAYTRAAAVMNPKYLLEGLALNPMKQAEEWELAKQYAPIAQWKDYGFFDIGVGPNMKRVIMGNDTMKDKIADLGMQPASMGDTIAWVRLWNASQAQVKAEHPELEVGSEQFYEEAGKVFSHVIDTTQVVDSVLHRSDVMKSKSTKVKNMTAFLSEPTKTYNMLFRAFADFVNSGGKKGKMALINTLAVWTVSQAVNSAVASFISALRDHDKDKGLLEKYIGKLIPDFKEAMNLFESIPFVKQWLAALQGEEVDEDATYDVLGQITDMFKEARKIMTGESKKGWWGFLYQLSRATTLWGGNNLQNPLRDIDGIIDNLIIRDNLEWYYQYQDAKYNMYAVNSNGGYPNLKQFVSTAMKAYAKGDKELGDRIVADLVKEIPEEKINDMFKSALKSEPEIEELTKATIDKDEQEAAEIKQSLLDKGYSEDMIDSALKNSVKAEKGTSEEFVRAFVEKSEGWNEQLKAFNAYNKGKETKKIRSSLKGDITEVYKPEYLSLDASSKKALKDKLLKLKYEGQYIYTSKDLNDWEK